MHVDEAIATAKTFFQRVFAEEKMSDPRLEEVEFDEVDHAWLITLSGLQPFAENRWTALTDPSTFERTYKTVKIDDSGSRLPSIKIRQLNGEV